MMLKKNDSSNQGSDSSKQDRGKTFDQKLALAKSGVGILGSIIGIIISVRAHMKQAKEEK